ncbi:hypothetical protein ACLB2K_020675 [Fragaria x ananassa]
MPATPFLLPGLIPDLPRRRWNEEECQRDRNRRSVIGREVLSEIAAQTSYRDLSSLLLHSNTVGEVWEHAREKKRRRRRWNDGETAEIRTKNSFGRPQLRRTVLRTSLRSPPSGADDGVPPSKRTPAASPITFSPRRIRRIPIFRRDQSSVKFWVEVVTQTFKSISSGKESDRGRCWKDAPSSEQSSGEWRDVRILSPIRTSL